jgi:hypothetical protein
MGLVADEPHGLKWDTKVLLLKIHCQYGVNPLLLDAPCFKAPSQDTGQQRSRSMKKP